MPRWPSDIGSARRSEALRCANDLPDKIRTMRFLVLLQVFLLLMTLLAVVPVAAAEPDPDPSATPSASHRSPQPNPRRRRPTPRPSTRRPRRVTHPRPTRRSRRRRSRAPNLPPLHLSSHARSLDRAEHRTDSTPTAIPTSAPVETSGYIVTFAPGTSGATQSDILATAGADVTATIPVLRLAFIAVPDGSSLVAEIRANGNVSSVELDRIRATEADPSDASYADQWALPKIGWDTVFGTAIRAAAPSSRSSTRASTDRSLISPASSSPARRSSTAPTARPTRTATAPPWPASSRPPPTTASGIAGVAYDGVKVMPVTVLGADGLGQDSDIIEGVVWAVAHGADVINMSFSNPGYSAALQAAIDYAWAHDVVVVAATGNDGSSSRHLPRRRPWRRRRLQYRPDDPLHGSSNFGADTFLGAPGTSIVTLDAGGGTTTITGTSASSAMVAAAAALLRANDPSASNGAIVGRLARNADPAGTASQTATGA